MTPILIVSSASAADEPAKIKAAATKAHLQLSTFPIP
jgi:hypothetical protein